MQVQPIPEKILPEHERMEFSSKTQCEVSVEPTDYDHLDNVVFSTGLDRWIDRVGNVISLAFLVSVVISFYEILSRYLFDAPTIWVHETTIMICALCMAYGGAYCLARDSHIRIRIIYDALGRRGKRMLDVFNGLLSLFYCALIAYAAFVLAEKALFTLAASFDWKRQVRPGIRYIPPWSSPGCSWCCCL
ncbi:TRAP transporter small permease subunit [Marinobacterium aestuariivivens]|uniref:TRAP transporter small permease protein n=1 Tax=Marinobacterium aestuariivivens TaxID=1698799 RepID=A0ABW2A5X3_9GAMM